MLGDLIDYVCAKTKAADPDKRGPGADYSPDRNQIKIVTKFVEVTSGTEELSFDWIVSSLPATAETIAPKVRE